MDTSTVLVTVSHVIVLTPLHVQRRVEQHLMSDPDAISPLPASRFMPLRQYDAQLLAAHLCYRDFGQFSKSARTQLQSLQPFSPFARL